MNIAFTVEVEGIINLSEFEDLPDEFQDLPDDFTESAEARRLWFNKIGTLFNEDLGWVLEHAHYTEHGLIQVGLT